MAYNGFRLPTGTRPGTGRSIAENRGALERIGIIGEWRLRVPKYQ